VQQCPTGASFRDVALTAEAAGRRVELTGLSAADRYGGRIAGRGELVPAVAQQGDHVVLAVAHERLGVDRRPGLLCGTRGGRHTR